MIIRDVIIFATLFFGFVDITRGQIDSVLVNKTEYSIYKQSKLLFTDTFKSGISVVASPFQKWNNTKIYNTVLVFGTTSFTYFFIDQALMKNYHSNISDNWKNVGKSYSEFGNPVFVGASVLGLGVVGITLKNSRLSRVVYLSAQSFAISMTLCYATKFLSGRLRPNYSDNSEMWYGPNWGQNYKRSFFSGHTAAIFSVATVFATEYDYIPWIPPLLYLFAGTISASRIFANDHWASDVVFAAGISHLIAKKIIDRHYKFANRYTVEPFLSVANFGFVIKF